MGLLGSLVKAGVEINQKLTREDTDPVHAQKIQLKRLLSVAANTSFGVYYDFEQILCSRDVIKTFQENVPIHSYEDMAENWWKQQRAHPDITWPGKPAYFALTSGTTGSEPKRIPVTLDFLESMRSVGTSLISSLPNFDFPRETYESEILMLSSTSNLKQYPDGHLEGEISGINVYNFPDWYEMFYRPGKVIAKIPEWEDRITAIAKAAPNWNIGAIAGIPAWILEMLKEIKSMHNLEYIQDIWPEFRIYATGGVAYDTYRNDFNALSSRELTIIDTYLASEGFFAYTARKNTMSMQLAINHGYFFEFIPFDERGVDDQGNILENPIALTIGDVEMETEYVLVVSSTAGAWRYVIGDTIKFTSLDPPEIKITGRTKFYLNVVGSQLSEEKLDAAVITAAKYFDTTINEYIVGAVRNEDGEYIHQWVLVCEDKPDPIQLAEKLDNLLQESNKNYGVARRKSLVGVKASVITKNEYHAYLEKVKKRKGGQVKTPKVMSEEKMKEMLSIIKQE